MTGRRHLAVVLAALLAIAGASAKSRTDEDPPPAPGAHAVTFDGGVRIDAVLPGKLVSYAVPATGDGGRSIYILGRRAAPEEEDDEDDGPRLPPCPATEGDGPLLLFRFDPAGDGALIPVMDNLPADATALDSLDLDGDGRDELLLLRDGAVDVVETSAADAPDSVGRTVLLSDPDLKVENTDPRIIRYPFLEGHRGFAVVVLGGLRYYAPDAEGDDWSLRATIPIPIEARRQGSGFRVFSPVPAPVGVRTDGTVVYASPPKAYGDRRLRVLRLEPSAGEAARVVEAWCRLPGPEEVLNSTLFLLDGRPVLVATTRRSDKLALFGERKLRLWFLEQDRSSAGMDPMFAAETRMNLWQDDHPVVLDVNGDGREDLVAGYWKGIFKSKVVLDAYLRQEDGTFDPKPRTTAFDVKDGDEDVLDYGRDLDGDGLPDLLVKNDAAFLVHRGLASDNGKKLVETAPSLTLPRPKRGGSNPRMIDLDGDGRVEVVLVRRSGERAGLQVYRLDR